jgi:hypothetical protein
MPAIGWYVFKVYLRVKKMKRGEETTTSTM